MPVSKVRPVRSETCFTIRGKRKYRIIALPEFFLAHAEIIPVYVITEKRKAAKERARFSNDTNIVVAGREGWRGGSGKCVRGRITGSAGISRLNNCDPPVTSRYKRRTVELEETREKRRRGRAGKHTYAACAGSKYRSFVGFIKFIKRPAPWLRTTGATQAASCSP